MVSSSIIEEIQQATKQPTLAGLPDRLSSFIQSSCECNPKLTKDGFVASNSLTNATSGALMTAPSSDFGMYICSAQMSWVRDATATSLLFNLIYVNEYGATINFLSVPGVTLTAGSGSTSIVFPHPLKVLPGSALTINSSTNVGNFKVSAQINYYLDENAKYG